MDEQIYLPRTGLVITERCNLACKLCAEYSPYYSNPPHATFEKIKKAIDIYFKCVDSVGDFSIFGGEPLLHKDVYNVLEYLSTYLERIKCLMILTNGTVLPSEDKLSVLLKQYPKLIDKLQINISNYGEKLSKRADEVEEVCDRLKIRCRVINYHGDNLFCDGWVDYGDHTQKFFTKEDILEHARKCNFRKDIYSNINFLKGKIYFMRCGRAFWRKVLGVTPADSSDVICFPDEVTSENKDILRRRIRELITAEYSDSCAFCNGMCDDSVRYAPAEQLSKEELTLIKRARMDMRNNSL